VETSLVPVHDWFGASDAADLDVAHLSAIVVDFLLGHLLKLTCFDVIILLDFFHFEMRFGARKDFLSHLDLLLRFV